MANTSANPIQEISEAWASLYPLVQWVLDHPFGSLVTGFVGLYLVWGLLRGLIQLTENLWIKLLRSPLWLVQRAWLLTGKGRPKLTWWQGNDPSQPTDRDRLHALITQLEESNQAQQDLIQKAKELLNQMNMSE